MFHGFGWPEALIVLAVILIVFGVGKLPQVGGAIGKGMREFRRGQTGLLDEPKEEERTPNHTVEATKNLAASDQ